MVQESPKVLALTFHFCFNVLSELCMENPKLALSCTLEELVHCGIGMEWSMKEGVVLGCRDLPRPRHSLRSPWLPPCADAPECRFSHCRQASHCPVDPPYCPAPRRRILPWTSDLGTVHCSPTIGRLTPSFIGNRDHISSTAQKRKNILWDGDHTCREPFANMCCIKRSCTHI